MKVKTLITTLEKTLTLLKYYENQTIDHMLDDLHNKIQKDSSLTANKPSNDIAIPQSKPSQIKATVASVDPEFVKKLEHLPKNDLKVTLSQYKKAELIAIGEKLDLKLQHRLKKDELIQSLLHHYEFIRLNLPSASNQSV